MVLRYPLWKKILLWAVCLLAVVFALPNLVNKEKFPFPIVFDYVSTINLGLDLRGGAHLLLQVNAGEVIQEHLEKLADSARQILKREQIIASRPTIQNKRVLVVQLADPRQVDKFIAAMKRENEDISTSYIDGGEVGFALQETLIRNLQIDTVDQSIEIIRRRIDETGTREPLIQRQGSSRIVVQVPGLRDPESLKSLIGQTAKLTFHLVSQQTVSSSNDIPAGYIRVESRERTEDGEPLDYYVITKRALVSGENLRDAGVTFDENNQPAVDFTFDSAGAFKFGAVTSANIGRRLAILLDDEIVSAPVIQSAIIGGNGIITGDFTVAEATELGILLRAGALPAALDVVEERSVGPGLGSDSIDAGTKAFIVALIAVALFILFIYGQFGFFANIALLINIMLIVAVLSILQATLTLPGIAGIILTIGMAVDANVLIFERIREEYRNGRTPIESIDSGYRQAFITILDANITTLIAAFLLFILGAGPIKGFAVTLSIGVFTSMFCAIILSRYFVIGWAIRNKDRDYLPLT